MFMPILFFYTFFVFALAADKGQMNAQTDGQTSNAAYKRTALIIR